jgi:chaperonin GroES
MADVKIRPLHDRVLVRRLEENEKTAGGIYIPDTAKEKPSRGQIVAIGKGKLLESGDIRPLDVKVGDTVLFGKYAGTEVRVAEQDYLVMREDDIMGVIEG